VGTGNVVEVGVGGAEVTVDVGAGAVVGVNEDEVVTDATVVVARADDGCDPAEHPAATSIVATKATVATDDTRRAYPGASRPSGWGLRRHAAPTRL